MTDLPILFSAPMVRALIAGRKTQTRRVLKPQPGGHVHRYGWSRESGATWTADRNSGRIPIWAGDRLWVREAWRVSQKNDATKPADLAPRSMTVLFEAGGSIANQMNHRWEPDPHYPAERPSWAGRMRPGMFLPRWASRLTLTVADVKIERLQEISAADAIAEGIYRVDPTPEDLRAGCTPDDYVYMAPGTRQGWGMTREARAREQWGPDPAFAYRCLWESINGPLSWAENPWVVAYTFTVRHHNIDAEGAQANG